MRILHLEDDPVWAEKVRSRLEQEGWTVVHVTTAAMAVDELCSGGYDFAVFDANTSDCTDEAGFAAVRCLARQIKSLFLSAMDDPRESKNCTPWFNKMDGEVDELLDRVVEHIKSVMMSTC